MKLSATQAFFFDIWTCLTHGRSVWIRGVEYRLKKSRIWIYYHDINNKKVGITSIGLNTFLGRCIELPEATKQTVRRLALELRSQEEFDYHDEVELRDAHQAS